MANQRFREVSNLPQAIQQSCEEVQGTLAQNPFP